MTIQDKKKYAALAYALASTRGVLHDIINGNIDKDEVLRVYNGTTLENILDTIKVENYGKDMDWNNFLTKEDKEKIAGK